MDAEAGIHILPVKASLYMWLLCYINSFQIVLCCMTEPGS